MRLRLPTLQSLGWRRSTLPALFGADLRALGPVHACTCGCTMFNIMAAFEDYDIAWWHLDGTCANCGNLLVPYLVLWTIQRIELHFFNCATNAKIGPHPGFLLSRGRCLALYYKDYSLSSTSPNSVSVLSAHLIAGAVTAPISTAY
jgi:hypothetical protein